MEKRFFIIIIFLITIFGCGHKEDGSRFKSEVIDGIKHLYNSGQPEKGTRILVAKEIRRFDSETIDDGVSFRSFDYDETGCCYIMDKRKVRLYKFDQNGNYLNHFLSKGEGPGEFKSAPQFQITDNILCNGSVKLVKFDRSGKLLSEKKFEKGGFGYSDLKIIDEQTFIARYSEYETSGKERKRKALIRLIDSNEKTLVTYSESDKTGRVLIRMGSSAIIFTHHALTPEVLMQYDSSKKRLYLADNDEYQVKIQSLDGKVESIIHLEHQNMVLAGASEEEVLKQFKRWPADVQKAIKDNLPQKILAIRSLALLPKDYLAVTRITGVGKEDVEIDIFNAEGKLAHTILPSDEFPDLSKLKFFKDKVAIIKDIDDRDILIEYQITNLPDIYKN